MQGDLPVIASRTTILTSQQLPAGTAVYATPLSTFAIAHARETADTVANNLDPLIDGLLGDGNGSISPTEFIAALETSTRNIKVTLGLGLLDENIDIFTTSPIVDATTDPEQTLAIRTANEVFAAIVNNLTTEVNNDGLAVSGARILTSLADDFSDGTFDKANDGLAINELSNVNDSGATFTANPLQLIVPGTDKTIAE
jgi:hypothetical protein